MVNLRFLSGKWDENTLMNFDKTCQDKVKKHAKFYISRFVLLDSFIEFLMILLVLKVIKNLKKRTNFFYSSKIK